MKRTETTSKQLLDGKPLSYSPFCLPFIFRTVISDTAQKIHSECLSITQILLEVYCNALTYFSRPRRFPCHLCPHKLMRKVLQQKRILQWHFRFYVQSNLNFEPPLYNGHLVVYCLAGRPYIHSCFSLFTMATSPQRQQPQNVSQLPTYRLGNGRSTTNNCISKTPLFIANVTKLDLYRASLLSVSICFLFFI